MAVRHSWVETHGRGTSEADTDASTVEEMFADIRMNEKNRTEEIWWRFRCWDFLLLLGSSKGEYGDSMFPRCFLNDCDHRTQ
jgi:hypothetical protein